MTGQYRTGRDGRGGEGRGRDRTGRDRTGPDHTGHRYLRHFVTLAGAKAGANAGRSRPTAAGLEAGEGLSGVKANTRAANTTLFHMLQTAPHHWAPEP